jgi:hypothetical protein
LDCRRAAAIILKANKANLFVSSVLFVFWYHSPNFSDTPHICDISRIRVNTALPLVWKRGNTNTQSFNGPVYFSFLREFFIHRYD